MFVGPSPPGRGWRAGVACVPARVAVGPQAAAAAAPWPARGPRAGHSHHSQLVSDAPAPAPARARQPAPLLPPSPARARFTPCPLASRCSHLPGGAIRCAVPAPVAEGAQPRSGEGIVDQRGGGPPRPLPPPPPSVPGPCAPPTPPTPATAPASTHASLAVAVLRHPQGAPRTTPPARRPRGAAIWDPPAAPRARAPAACRGRGSQPPAPSRPRLHTNRSQNPAAGG